MEEYTVDIGSFISGRTVKVEAVDVRQALSKARKLLRHDRFERVIQIRDDRDYFYYTYEHGIIEK